MADEKFTPGPWLIREASTSSGLWLELFREGAWFDDCSEFVIAETGTTKDRRDSSQRWRSTRDRGVHEANTHLISAAPDMYAVLKSMESDEDDPMRIGDPRRSRLLVALEKARGNL